MEIHVSHITPNVEQLKTSEPALMEIPAMLCATKEQTVVIKILNRQIQSKIVSFCR